MTTQMILISVIVGLEYLFLIFSKRFRALSMWIALTACVIFGLLTFREIFYYINWNVMGIFVGTFILADAFIYSRVPELLARFFVDRTSSIGGAILWMCLLSSIISVFVENVATVLIVAPVAFEIARQQKVSPVPFIICIAIASNLQGTATLIGDPPSMILAAFKGMGFNDFFFYEGRLSIFWAVQAGAVLSFIVLYFMFKSYKQKTVKLKINNVRSYLPVWLLVVMIIALALSSSFDPDFIWLAGTICVITGFVSILWISFSDRREFTRVLKKYDYDTTFFLAGIFVLIAILEKVGVIDKIGYYIMSITGTDIFLVYTLIILVSVILSALIDNVPYIITMLPIVRLMADNLGIHENLLIFGLLVGSCLGGNITPVGASANIVSIGLLKEKGYRVSFLDFMKIGLPFTVAAVLGGYLMIWFIWK